MEAQAPSPYTGFYQQPWYKGRGYFLDPPTVAMHDGVWKLSLPQEIETLKPSLEDLTFSLRENIFKESRDTANLADIYHSYIWKTLQLIIDSSGSTQTGALIIEPVIQGAGGMVMVDPLFQRVLVKECRNQKIPVIFDEVFTGFWRLGAESATEFIRCKPDIACFAKLMTGGIVPLAVTLASEAVFGAFIGDSKLQALLHGHSYTAHAVGCTAAVKSIKWFKDSKSNHNLISEAMLLRELWDSDMVRQISLLPAVHRVVVLGEFSYKEMAHHCEALLTGKQQKMYNLMNSQHRQDNALIGISESSSDQGEESASDNQVENQLADQKVADVSDKPTREIVPSHCGAEYQSNPESFRLPASSPYDNFLKAARW